MRLLAMLIFCRHALHTIKKTLSRLSDYVQQLQNQEYILAPYADYWLMLLNLEDADNQTVTDFLATYSEYPFADQIAWRISKKTG